MRFEPEALHGANNGLNIARGLLEKVKQEFPWISYGDLWTLAGVCAIQVLTLRRVGLAFWSSDRLRVIRRCKDRRFRGDRGVSTGSRRTRRRTAACLMQRRAPTIFDRLVMLFITTIYCGS